MGKIKEPKPLPLPPLETGQIWSVAGLKLHVGIVGKLLVHYKLAKPDAVRNPNQINSKATIVKYLKKNKATLLQTAKAA